MLSKKKQKALLVVVVTGLILIAAVSVVGYLAYLALPLLVALICLVVGMLVKWGIEWFLKNIDRFKVKERARAVEQKLKIDKGVNLVKESIETLKAKDEANVENSERNTR